MKSGTVAFIPARGGSKGIPGKNIRLLGGMPLIYWTAKAASDCADIDCVVISTDDPGIAAAAHALCLPKLRVVGRSPETATDTATTESALLEFARTSECETIVLIQATSPLLKSEELLAALTKFRGTGCDSLLSTVVQKRFIWAATDCGLARPVNYDPQQRPRRQDFVGYEVENGAFYIMSRAGLLQSGCRLHGNIATYQMASDSFTEIDEPEDWRHVEHLLSRRSRSGNIAERAKKIKIVLTDVDGVLTDAGMYYSNSGDELKRFNTRDGKGMELLRAAGVLVGIVTAEDTEIVSRRANKLKVDVLRQGASNKLQIVEAILVERGLKWDELAYIGDDLNDLEVLKLAGLAAAPADAVSECFAAVHFQCKQRGGGGCFRELANLLLANR